MNSKEQLSILKLLEDINILFNQGKIKDGDKWLYGLVYPHTFNHLIPKIEDAIAVLEAEIKFNEL
jgi:hypothetical protein